MAVNFLTTDWGVVTRSIITRLSELVDEGVIRQVQLATAEDLATYAPKAFPAIAVEWKPVDSVKSYTLLTNTFSVKVRANWDIHHFCSTGKTDAAGAFEKNGPFRVSLAVREKLLGFCPEGQLVGNGNGDQQAFQLNYNGEGEIERFVRGGSGGMLVRVPYWMEQVISAVGG